MIKDDKFNSYYFSFGMRKGVWRTIILFQLFSKQNFLYDFCDNLKTFCELLSKLKDERVNTCIIIYSNLTESLLLSDNLIYGKSFLAPLIDQETMSVHQITLISLPRTLEIYLNEATQSKKRKPQHQRYEVTMSKER